MFPVLLGIFLIVPIIEIYLLIQVGSLIGVGWTIVLVVLTAVLGATLVRNQGFATWNRIQMQIDAGELPATELIEGLFLLLAGALLLTPGFFTDGIGFACLIPPLRRAAIRYAIARRIVVAHVGRSGTAAPPERGSRTIEGEYRRVDD